MLYSLKCSLINGLSITKKKKKLFEPVVTEVSVFNQTDFSSL